MIVYRSLCFMKNLKYLELDVFSYDFYKTMWDIVGDELNLLALEAFILGCDMNLKWGYSIISNVLKVVFYVKGNLIDI